MTINIELLEDIDKSVRETRGGISRSRYGFLIRRILTALNGCLPLPSVVSYVQDDYSQADYLSNITLVMDKIYEMVRC